MRPNCNECLSFQVTIGKQCNNVTVEDTQSLQVGSLAAVNVENFPPPCIGVVQTLGDKEIEVQWLQGAYDKPWQPCLVEAPQDRRKKVPLCDWVPRETIILFDFQLTKTNHLRKKNSKLTQIYLHQYQCMNIVFTHDYHTM